MHSKKLLRIFFVTSRVVTALLPPKHVLGEVIYPNTSSNWNATTFLLPTINSSSTSWASISNPITVTILKTISVTENRTITASDRTSASLAHVLPKIANITHLSVTFSGRYTNSTTNSTRRAATTSFTSNTCSRTAYDVDFPVTWRTFSGFCEYYDAKGNYGDFLSYGDSCFLNFCTSSHTSKWISYTGPPLTELGTDYFPALEVYWTTFSDGKSKLVPDSTIATFSSTYIKDAEWQVEFGQYDPPCCGQCYLDVKNVDLFFWPDQAGIFASSSSLSPAHSTTIVDDRGFTFVSPSVYLGITSISGRDRCGNIGSPITTTTIPLDLHELSTIANGFFASYFGGATLPFPLYSTFNCTTISGSSTKYQTIVSHITRLLTLADVVQNCTTLPGYYPTPVPGFDSSNDDDPCHPFLALPAKILNIQPQWKSCTVSGPNPGLYDPPKTLIHGNTLVPSTTLTGFAHTVAPTPGQTIPSAPPNTGGIEGSTNRPVAPLPMQSPQSLDPGTRPVESGRFEVQSSGPEEAVPLSKFPLPTASTYTNRIVPGIVPGFVISTSVPSPIPFDPIEPAWIPLDQTQVSNYPGTYAQSIISNENTPSLRLPSPQFLPTTKPPSITIIIDGTTFTVSATSGQRLTLVVDGTTFTVPVEMKATISVSDNLRPLTATDSSLSDIKNLRQIIVTIEGKTFTLTATATSTITDSPRNRFFSTVVKDGRTFLVGPQITVPSVYSGRDTLMIIDGITFALFSGIQRVSQQGTATKTAKDAFSTQFEIQAEKDTSSLARSNTFQPTRTSAIPDRTNNAARASSHWLVGVGSWMGLFIYYLV
ncbi:hypothetical protein B0J11DRAFT_64980 [Dendryphion nanum]|uniref:Uncharacterized protein n=1 Tax=Dendryphion nanum TaxID=256645 RepID=A0A9P9DI44_9PLEO|nr:hypothetical protein B0J11DRAFT_64980 [Dendryphion nanum]